MRKDFILKEFEYLQYKDNTKDNFIKKDIFDSLEKFVLENEKTAQYLNPDFAIGYSWYKLIL